MINNEDLIMIKIVLDIVEHYILNYDKILSHHYLNEFVPTANLFYSHLSQEEVEILYERVFGDDEIKILLVDKLKVKIFRSKSSYLKIMNKMKIEKHSLIEGIEEKLFIL